jgi:hypothetical protein
VDVASEAQARAWWEEITGKGGEWVVMKPLSFVALGIEGLCPRREWSSDLESNRIRFLSKRPASGRRSFPRRAEN